MASKRQTESIRYIGRYDAVELWCPDGRRETVNNGGTLDTTAEHAASLLTQEGEWEPAKAAPEKEG